MANSISFNIITKEFSKVIGLCNQVSMKKSDIELFTFTKIDLDDNGLQVFATNGSVFYRSNLKLQGVTEESKVSFLVKTDQLAGILSIMNDEKLDINVDIEKHTMQLKGGKSKHQLRIATENIEKYIIPEYKDEGVKVRFTLGVEQMLEANKAATISVGLPKNMYEPAFLNICYTIFPEQKQLAIVSTDRFRITKNLLDVEFISIADQITETPFTNFLIPPKNLQLLAAAVDNSKDLEVIFEDEMTYFVFGSNQIISRYGEGKYADYNKIIPVSFACSFEASTQEFLSGIRQAYWCIRGDLNHSIKLTFKPAEGKIVFNTQNTDGDTAESEVAIERYEGMQEEWSQAFNADYLTDYISILKSESFLWEANPGKPAVISPLAGKDKQFYLVSGLK